MNKAKIYFRLLIVCLTGSGGPAIVLSQNLVPNPSFETYTECPLNYNTGEPLQCTPWQKGSFGTSDYFNVCSNPSSVGVPDNIFGTQEAHTGDAYAGSWYISFGDYREYLQVQLTEPCIAGFSYEISYYISLSDFTCGIGNFGIYFSVDPPPGSTWGPLDVVPQIEANIGLVTDNQNWTLLTGCFFAQGGEQWITIGNFYDDSNSPYEDGCVPIFDEGISYYYMDDVSVIQSVPYNILALYLGDPVFVCSEYEIDPGVSGVEYQWSDGSSEPTLVVTESGTYSLTITEGCNAYGVDSVEVTFLGILEGVDLGPQEVTICDGDSYTISLDPDLGEYEWQDGSTDAEYVITTEGIYSVSMDDGCDITSDVVIVTVQEEPAPFSLGDDTYFCPGGQIVYDFDPGLGNFLWQDNSSSPYYVITEEGSYSLTISNTCGEVVDDIEIILIEPPEFSLGPDEQTLCDGQVIVLEFDPLLGDFMWQDGSNLNSY
ncbi:MAG: hypothetical protein ABIQ02_08715, partial [Saprospiraceae bacterium]